MLFNLDKKYKICRCKMEKLRVHVDYALQYQLKGSQM